MTGSKRACEPSRGDWQSAELSRETTHAHSCDSDRSVADIISRRLFSAMAAAAVATTVSGEAAAAAGVARAVKRVAEAPKQVSANVQTL